MEAAIRMNSSPFIFPLMGDELEHHGIKGQKWGVRRTPEELGHVLKKANARHYGKYNKAIRTISAIQGGKTIEQLTPKEKAKMEKAISVAQKHLQKIGANEKKYGEKIAQATEIQNQNKAKAAAKEQEAAAKNAKLKEKLIKDGDWNAIMNRKDLFSTNELNEVANRINAEQRVKAAMNSGKGFDKLASNLKTAANVAGAGLELYDKVNKIKGIFDEGKKEKAYSELRALMAEGKNAEVIKRSTSISDKDVENFSKRLKLLGDLGKASGISTPTSSTAAPKTDTKKSAKDDANYKAAVNALLSSTLSDKLSDPVATVKPSVATGESKSNKSNLVAGIARNELPNGSYKESAIFSNIRSGQYTYAQRVKDARSFEQLALSNIGDLRADLLGTYGTYTTVGDKSRGSDGSRVVEFRI